MRRNGFTLAEVLITLGIIGIVAAITIPTITSDTQTAKIGPKLAKAASVFEQGNESLLNKNSVDALTDGELVESAGDYCDLLLNYMKGSCDGTKLTLVDGVSYDITISDSSTSPVMPHRHKIGSIVVDINGESKPNKSAEDIFYFTLYDDGSLRPQGGKNWDEANSDADTWETKCPADAEPSAPEYCAGHVFENNLKVLYK